MMKQMVQSGGQISSSVPAVSEDLDNNKATQYEEELMEKKETKWQKEELIADEILANFAGPIQCSPKYRCVSARAHNCAILPLPLLLLCA